MRLTSLITASSHCTLIWSYVDVCSIKMIYNLVQGTILKLRICCLIVAEKKTAAAAFFPIFSFIALLSIKSFSQLLYFTQIEGKTFWLSMMTQWKICRRKWMNGWNEWESNFKCDNFFYINAVLRLAIVFLIKIDVIAIKTLCAPFISIKIV